MQTHRVAYKIYYAVDPNELHVRHVCHNPPCVNPLHLILGTHQDNMRDRDEAGRQVTAHGADHKLAKLTEDNVRDIRQRFETSGVAQSVLAREFGVSHRLIRNIINRTAWGHI